MEPEDAALLRILVMKERVIVMVQLMEVVMMEIAVAKEVWFVEATIARNLVYTSMRNMIAVKSPQATQEHLNLKFTYQEPHLNRKKVRQIFKVSAEGEDINPPTPSSWS